VELHHLPTPRTPRSFHPHATVASIDQYRYSLAHQLAPLPTGFGLDLPKGGFRMGVAPYLQPIKGGVGQL